MILGLGVLVETSVDGDLWTADVPALPGVTACGRTEPEAIQDVHLLAAAVLAGRVPLPIMVLRDELAGHALAVTVPGSPASRAREAYQIADAMIEARRRR